MHQELRYNNNELEETMKPTMKELLKEWRQNLTEHVTDEEHEHPHGDESDEDHCDENINESDYVEQGLGATTFEQWVANDDSVVQIGGPGNQEYVWGCDPTGGEYEMEYIIKRIRELYDLGGSVEQIQIMYLGQN